MFIDAVIKTTNDKRTVYLAAGNATRLVHIKTGTRHTAQYDSNVVLEGSVMDAFRSWPNFDGLRL